MTRMIDLLVLRPAVRSLRAEPILLLHLNVFPSIAHSFILKGPEMIFFITLIINTQHLHPGQNIPSY